MPQANSGRARSTSNAFSCALIAIVAAASLAGCGGGGYGGNNSPSPPTSNPPPGQPGVSVHGVVNGAHRLVKGASVTLYRVGVSDYGSDGVALGTAITDAAGAWIVTFPQPTDDPLVYVATRGGDVGFGPNSAIALLAAPGTLSRVPSKVTVNEVSTAASVYSLAQFLDPATATNVGAPASNAVGLTNAFGTVPNLVDVSSGAPLASTDVFTPIVNPVTLASEAPPVRLLNTLAEVISACIASTGPASTGCTALFGSATPSGGTAPTDTRQALLDIALHPENNVAALFNLARTLGVAFAPDMGTVAPNDWTLTINFTGGALAGSIPLGVAIDSAGDVWVTGQRFSAPPAILAGGLVELHPQGSQAGPYPNTPGMVLNLALGGGAIAIGTDPGNGREIVWVASIAQRGLFAFDARDGSPLLAAPITAGGHFRNPETLATDTLGNVWVMNAAPRFLTDGSTVTSLIELSPGPANDYSVTGVFDYARAAGVVAPAFQDLALDGDSPANIWAVDGNTGQIVEFSGASPGVQSATRTFVSPGMKLPGPIAVAANGNVWTADVLGGASELLGGNVAVDISNNMISNPGEPGGIAIDGSGNVWVSNTDNSGNKGVVELDPSGVSLSGFTALGSYNGGSPPTGGPLGVSNVGSSPRGIAIDQSGNVWVATGEISGVVELVGAASPVKTPRHGPPVRP